MKGEQVPEVAKVIDVMVCKKGIRAARAFNLQGYGFWDSFNTNIPDHVPPYYGGDISIGDFMEGQAYRRHYSLVAQADLAYLGCIDLAVLAWGGL